LSSKWDSLDTNTQRYIATIAAGSRQQSRFIAMMSDYSRTSELVAAANNSAGASNEQFEKTLDSLQSKLNQLKNAWDTFTMSLMNNEVIKLGVDILTKLMETINGIVALFDKVGLGGPAAIGLVVAALYLGDRALKVFTASLQKGTSIFGSFGAVGRAAIDSITARFTKMKKGLSEMKKQL
jgi:TP901 family phage tail tape measure protein